MSRDARADSRVEQPARTAEARAERERSAPAPRVPMDRLALPRTDARERVTLGDRVYQLRASEARTLATVGTFRLVPADQLDEARGTYWDGDLQRLDAAGLIERKTITVNDQPMRLAVLTREGQALLAAKQDQDTGRPRQQYHAGLVKPREAAHDAQLHRLFQAEGARIEGGGGRIERGGLD